jgi:hypothetical protein
MFNPLADSKRLWRWFVCTTGKAESWFSESSAAGR